MKRIIIAAIALISIAGIVYAYSGCELDYRCYRECVNDGGNRNLCYQACLVCF